MFPAVNLILWAEELRNKPAVIVNCAGRTRSIIGAATLRRLGLTNVRALSNGTMGWLLAGYELESKPARRGSDAGKPGASGSGGAADRRRGRARLDHAWRARADIPERRRWC